jgi:predicted nucleic acid-binding protein
MIVSDAGPVIIFARIGRLSLLHEITGLLTIPAAVYAEIMANNGSMPGASEVTQAVWIQRTIVANRSLSAAAAHGLHAGEHEAIALAKERGAQLLMDEIRGRRLASQLGIGVIGTLRIPAEAKRLGHLESVGPIVDEMRSSGYRFDRGLIRRFLEEVHEI